MKSAHERFFDKVDKTFECWLWSAAINANGYGIFGFDGKTQLAHRLSYELFKGAIPEGLHVCHTCDVPKCVNPKHLWLGTDRDNMRDRDLKGRGKWSRGAKNGAFTKPWTRATGDRNGARTRPESLPRGEKHVRAKVTAAEVTEIRRLRSAGTVYRVLAEKFGLSIPGVQHIVYGDSWKHTLAQPEKVVTE